MKKIQFLKVAATAILVASLLFLLKGCKKTESDLTPAQQIAADYKELYKNVSAAVVSPINKPADDVFYKNEQGQMQSLYEGTGHNSIPNTGGGITSGPPNFNCQYNCGNTTNPANLVINFNLLSAERLYNCEPNNNMSSVLVRWTMSGPFTKFQNVGVGGLTICRVKFSAPGQGDLIYNAVPGNPNPNEYFTVRFLGATNTYCATGHNLFEITCRINQVSNTVFQSGWTVSSQLELDVNCPLVGNVIGSSYVNGPAFSQNSYLPCNRIDKVFFNPPGGGNNYSSVTGLYTLNCLPPAGMQPIDNHQVEYRQVTNTNSKRWADQNGTIYQGVLPPLNNQFSSIMSPNGGVLNLLNMTTGSGWWLIRYRNVKTSNGCDVFAFPPTPFQWTEPALYNVEAWLL